MVTGQQIGREIALCGYAKGGTEVEGRAFFLRS
jgi:hypothetical protein